MTDRRRLLDGIWCPHGRGVRHRTPGCADLAFGALAYRCPCGGWHRTAAHRVPDDALEVRGV